MKSQVSNKKEEPGYNLGSSFVPKALLIQLHVIIQQLVKRDIEKLGDHHNKIQGRFLAGLNPTDMGMGSKAKLTR